ncbi:C-mannosyltransferase dpy-19 homolog [Sitodiplosis mosellana]|uniref:C-mannosyltransferase dpy-19 homolog n=1 Tax=Sitodiplosis mosellana TaxID=263140 RepID=UPI0024448946|nr:C-mannosyltransferase dpy-19 homolog [Sitodiplosis mosellana]
MGEQNTMKSRLMLSTAHALIGLGLILIQVLHTSSVFETKTNFSRKNRLERQLYFRNEDAIYMYIYHTLAEAKDFRTGFAQILRNNYTEHLHTVNSIERYSILPEIVIAYLYKQFIQLTIYYNIPTVSCWERVASSETHSLDNGRIDVDDTDDIFYRHNLYYYYDQHTNVVCDGPGLPIFFYLEVTFYLGGLTLFTIYLFATYLSRNVFAGLCAALYYFCIHNDATRIHTNPAARENFAIPFIISQIYFLTVWIEQHNRYYTKVDKQKDDANQTERPEEDDRSNHFKLGFFTAFAILAWDFSTYIFTTQIVIILLMVKMRLIKRRHIFLQNFILSHIMARLIANNIVKYGWVEFHQKPMNFDCSALITLLLYIVQKYPTKQQRLRTIERVILRLFLLVMAFTTILELVSERNFYSQYMDVLLTKLYLKEPSFTSLLTMCRKDYKFIDFATLNAYNCLFVSKVLIVFMLTWVVNWLKRQRDLDECSDDRIQRAKNYLLEDYLEENKLSMADLAKIEKNSKLQECMDLLKVCKYDYERYKMERKRMLEEESRERPQIERDAFLNEVRRFKSEISESTEGCPVDDIEINHPPEDSYNDKKDTESQNDTNEQPNGDTVGNDDSTSNNNDGGGDDEEEEVYDWRKLLTIERPEYFYNLAQTAAFFILTVLIIKVKYVLTPFLCLMATTFPPKALIPRNYSLWLIYAIVIGSCMIDRGIHNFREQYNLKEGAESTDNLEQNNLHDMLKWIKSNTDRTEVFAGPDDVIGLVLLSTGRPIANNALSNHPTMQERSKIVYSMMSKQDSNSVYVQLAELKIDYIIVSHRDCFGYNDGCKISTIWDLIQPEYINNIQLCADLFQRANLNFLKIFVNEHYMILKIFERFQIDLNLIQVQMQEKNM